MKVLGISTAAKVISAGLIEGTEEKGCIPIAGFTSDSFRSEDLMVLIDRICRESGTDPSSIDLIGVCSGPGSYSGLRGGMAAAKSLAQVLDKPILGISTLEAMAFNLVDIKGTVAVILDAVRSEVNFALFTSDTKKLRRLTGDLVISLERAEQILEEEQGPLHVVTSMPELDKSKGDLIFSSPDHSHPLGLNTACLAYQGFIEGKRDDAISLSPKYSHTPNVKEYVKKTE